jgi:D-alanine transaminase
MLDGVLLPYAEAAVPIDDRGLLFGESLYEVVPVVGSRPCRLEVHLERLRRGATALGIERGIPRLDIWMDFTRRLQELEGHGESLLYFQVTGGSGPRVHAPAAPRRPRWFACLRQHRFPTPSNSARGVAVMTLPELRWGRRDLKTTMLLPAVWAKEAARRVGAHEALFVAPDDRVLEGGSSNVFVVRGSVISTPPLGTELLAGTTRGAVLAAAQALGLPVQEEPLRRADLLQCDEAFVASTSQLCTAITSVDGEPLRSSDHATVRRLSAELRRAMGLIPDPDESCP